MVLLAVVIFTGIDVYLALKNARSRKPKYFNIVGKVGRIDNKVLYVVEICPKDAAKACARIVPEEGKFYRYAFKEELYD